MRRKAVSAAMISTTVPTPAPIPAFAPVLKLVAEAVCPKDPVFVDEEVGVALVAVAVIVNGEVAVKVMYDPPIAESE